jgi:hypothetical protein
MAILRSSHKVGKTTPKAKLFKELLSRLNYHLYYGVVRSFLEWSCLISGIQRDQEITVKEKGRVFY